MIGTERTQYIRSEKLRGIVVTHRDYDQLRDANPDDSLILEEAKRITMANAELERLEPECVVIVYKKMRHLDAIRGHISNISLLTSTDVKNRFFPQIVLRVFHSLQNHSDDLSFYIMKLYEPDYKIVESAPEERTLASCGDRVTNVASIMRDMEFSDEISRGADKIFTDGPGFTNILAFALRAFKDYKKSAKPINVDADLSDM
jgi:hypothetical protein